MKRRRLVLIGFIVVAAVQLYVPFSMIWEREEIIDAGRLYKFRSAPIDPADPLRGRYVVLSYQDNYVEIPGDSIFFSGQNVYVIIENDASGFAKIVDIKLKKPSSETDFVKAEIASVSYSSDMSSIYVDYPFNRYYMEESKAPLAEELQNEAALDSSSITHVEVQILEGEAAVQGIYIDGVSIEELLTDPN